MKLIDAVKEKGGPFEIPDCSRDDLPGFFAEMGFKTGAEIGVYKADFTQKLCKPDLKIFAIDPWFGYPGTTQKRQDELYEHAKNVLSPYPNCSIIRKTSMDALADFPDNGLDFVYIDADHGFRYIAEDLVEWTKKVRPGGVVSGHDYFFVERGTGRTNWNVGFILKAYTRAFGIKDWYLLGKKDQTPNERRDEWLSWMFVKEK